MVCGIYYLFLYVFSMEEEIFLEGITFADFASAVEERSTSCGRSKVLLMEMCRIKEFKITYAHFPNSLRC